MDFRDSDEHDNLEIEVSLIHPSRVQTPTGMSGDMAHQRPSSAQLRHARVRRWRLGERMPPSHPGGQP
jgi:hypothetical protein